MAQQLRALDAFPEVLSSSPSTDMSAHSCNSSSKGFVLPLASSTRHRSGGQTYVQTEHPHTKLKTEILGLENLNTFHT